MSTPTDAQLIEFAKKALELIQEAFDSQDDSMLGNDISIIAAEMSLVTDNSGEDLEDEEDEVPS